MQKTKDRDGQRDGVNVDLDKLAINTIRTLSIDAIQKAESGHPGTPMGFAPAIYALWRDVMVYDPADPLWPNRDRFVFSVGHASMLLYATIFLAGIKEVGRDGKLTGRDALTLDDLKLFRQLGGRTTGHPEYGLVTGVETTTGPLGQGLAVSVGMALAEAWLARRYNKPGFTLFDHHVFAATGDGCLMEGISYEAAALAGHLGLSNLTWLYDRNRICIEGNIDLTFTEDIPRRFEAAGWTVVEAGDVNNLEEVYSALAKARASKTGPTLVIVDSVIGFGSPKQAGKAAAHGNPLGEEEVRATKRAYGWPEDEHFHVPQGVESHFSEPLARRGGQASQAWRESLAAYRKAHPDLARELDHILAGTLPEGLEKHFPTPHPDAKGVPTRDSSAQVMNVIGEAVPWFVGGAGDVGPSTKTIPTFKGAHAIQGPRAGGDYSGQLLHFGIREHAMGAICNGLAASGLRPYSAAYLTFSDYMKTPIRLAALMGLPVTFIFTHDSITVGEDGPTHQPIEHLLHFRAVPNLVVVRPGDAYEVNAMWRVALRDVRRPTLMALGRNATPTFARDKGFDPAVMERGGYILRDTPAPEVILIATGSELALAVAGWERLTAEGVAARVVSLPSWELFEEQEESYRNHVLPPAIKARVTIEASSVMGWERYAGPLGVSIGMHGFGEAGKAADVLAHFGFTEEAVIAAARKTIGLAAR